MTISCTLNHQPITIKTPANRRAVQIFKVDCSLSSTEACCKDGTCGKCLALIDNKLVLSCLIPAFSLRNKQIITLEGLKQLEEYQDMKRAAEKSGLLVCHNCEALVMLTTQSILQGDIPPTRWDIIGAFTHYDCSCAGTETLINFVQEARTLRRRRKSVRRT